jgi:hypothetical protein
VDLRIIDTLKAFALLRDEWDELLERSARPSPFISHGWLMAWWDVYARDDDRLHVVACRDASGDLVGALGAYVRRTGGPIPTRTLRHLADKQVGSYRLTCLADRSRQDEVFSAVAGHLLDPAAAWDVLDFRRADADSAFVSTLLAEPAAADRSTMRDCIIACPIVRLAEDWDAYLGTLSHRLRAVARQTRRKVEALDGFTLETVTDHSLLPGALEDAGRMYRALMLRRNPDSAAVTDDFERFLSQVSARFLELDWLRLMFLSLEGERVAFVYQLACGDTMLAYQTAFQERWAPQRVGMALFGYAIEGAIAEGLSYYDFLPGDEEYKFRWGATHAGELANTRVFGPSAAGMLAAAAATAATRTKYVVRKVSPSPMWDKARAVYYRRRERGGS